MSINYDKCKYPECIGNVIPNKTFEGLCARHSEMLKFFFWALESIRVNSKEKIDNEQVDSVLDNK